MNYRAAADQHHHRLHRFVIVRQIVPAEAAAQKLGLCCALFTTRTVDSLRANKLALPPRAHPWYSSRSIRCSSRQTTRQRQSKQYERAGSNAFMWKREKWNALRPAGSDDAEKCVPVTGSAEELAAAAKRKKRHAGRRSDL